MTRVCRFDGPNDRTYVEVHSDDGNGYVVFRCRPFPPPTRGDKVDKYEVRSYMEAVKLAAQLMRDLMDERLI